MANFTLKFFARLKEQTGTEKVELALADVNCLSDLISFLTEKNPDWAPFLSGKLMTAVNHQMVTGDQALKAGDEVALFPPVTGG